MVGVASVSCVKVRPPKSPADFPAGVAGAPQQQRHLLLGYLAHVDLAPPEAAPQIRRV